jgi:hypothetical protein
VSDFSFPDIARLEAETADEQAGEKTVTASSSLLCSLIQVGQQCYERGRTRALLRLVLLQLLEMLSTQAFGIV